MTSRICEFDVLPTFRQTRSSQTHADALFVLWQTYARDLRPMRFDLSTIDRPRVVSWMGAASEI